MLASASNLLAFTAKSLEDVLPKFRQCSKYLQDFTRFLYSARDFAQNIQNHAKENGTEQKYSYPI